jgi:hypothetical protein
MQERLGASKGASGCGPGGHNHPVTGVLVVMKGSPILEPAGEESRVNEA